MAKLSFDDIRNKEFGKVGIVCGTGGSLKQHITEFENLSKNNKKNYCFISCNEWPEKTNLDIDYWVIANSILTIQNKYAYFNSKPNTTLVYASSIDLTNKYFINNNLVLNYLPFDERHFNSSPCSEGICCAHINPNSKTIQEYLQQISGHDIMYNDCGTVGIHMLALAVILGCNPIYVSGIDMNYATGYVDGSDLKGTYGDLAEYASKFGEQAKIISDSAKKLGIEIINLSELATYGGLQKGEFIKPNTMQKRNILVALIHPEEWNQYIPFNGYLSTIKGNYDHTIGVVAEKPMALLSEADEYYTIKNGTLFSYPALLDTSARENESFIIKCAEKIKEDFKEDNLTFVSWQDTTYAKGIISITDHPAPVYRTAFANAIKWYKKEKLLCPTFNSFQKMSEKYGNLFNDNTFIVLSREYANKAPVHNTKNSITNFEAFLRHLTENNIKIVNIGFPPATCQITNDNYVEIYDEMTQDELLGIFYLAKGVLLQADAGGFTGHLASNADFFTLTEQWSLPGEFPLFDIISHRTKKRDTIELKNLLQLFTNPENIDNFDKIVKILSSYEPKKELVFQNVKKITFIE